MAKLNIPHTKSKEKKIKIKKKAKALPKKEQVQIVAQEIKFARLLSGNEKKGRDKVIKMLKKWLLNCFEKKYDFKEDDFIRVWKGLFYAIWMSDKPLVQEELCENISSVLDLFPPEHLKHALLMFKAGLRILATEWYGVDHHRMDKFLMLVRRYLRASLRCLLRSQWSVPGCVMYSKAISGSDGIFALKTPRYARNATSMLLHVMDCYLEEIAKVSSGEIPGASLAELLRPICAYLCGGELPVVCNGARRVLTSLVRQSEAGIKYQDATRAWQQMGCPEGGPEAMELVSDDDDDAQGEDGSEDEETTALDPRAGRVHVSLPLLSVPADLLANMLRELLPNAHHRAHRRLKICLERFEQLSREEYPLAIKPATDEVPARDVKPKKLARSLHVMERKLVAASDELALRGLSRKHRKRLLAKSRSGLSIVEDVESVQQELSSATNGDWQVETTEAAQEKNKNVINKENRKRKRDEENTVKKEVKKSKKVNNNDTDTDKHNKNDFKKDKFKDKVKIKTKISEKSNKKENRVNNINVKDIKLNDISSNNKIKDSKSNNKNELTKNKTSIVANGKVKVNKPVNKENNVTKTTLTNGNDKKETNKTQNKKENMSKTNKSQKNVDNKSKNYQKQTTKTDMSPNKSFETPKKVKFVLKNNSMQAPVDYYKSIRQSPSIPFDGTKIPTKTNLKPSTPSPINPFFKKKLRMKH